VPEIRSASGLAEELANSETGVGRPSYLGFAAYPREHLRPTLLGTAEEITMVALALRQLSLAALAWGAGIAAFVATVSQLPVAFDPILPLALLSLFQIPSLTIGMRAANKGWPAHRMNRTAFTIAGVVLCVVPFGMMLFLVSAGSRFTEYLKKANVSVGFLGVRTAQLESAVRLRREQRLPDYGPEFKSG